MRVMTVSSDLGKFKAGTKLHNLEIVEYIRLLVRDKAEPSEGRIWQAVMACRLPEDADPKAVEADIISRLQATEKAATKTASNSDDGRSELSTRRSVQEAAQAGGRLDRVLSNPEDRQDCSVSAEATHYRQKSTTHAIPAKRVKARIRPSQRLTKPAVEQVDAACKERHVKKTSKAKDDPLHDVELKPPVFHALLKLVIKNWDNVRQTVL